MKNISVTYLRKHIRDILDDVYFRGDTYRIARGGSVSVSVIPTEITDRWEDHHEMPVVRFRENLREVLDDLGRGVRDFVVLTRYGRPVVRVVPGDQMIDQIS